MNTTKLSIKQWAEEDRPSEKLRQKGADVLTDAELLALLIGSGTVKMTAVEVARNILDKFGGNLNSLGKARLEDLTNIDGIGNYTATRIMAAMELGKRREGTQREQQPEISSAIRIYRYMHPLLMDLDVEQAHVLYMNQNFRLIKTVKVGQGGITCTTVDVRIIMREAVLCNATVIALVHNHPSGSLTPSSADDSLTQSVKKAASFMNIHMMDHVIVTDGSYFSYREQGRI